MIRHSLAASALALVACAAPPVDPEGTLDRVRGGTMRVGVVAHPPWTTIPSTGPGGVEVEIVERLAESLDAQVEWTEGSEQQLFGALEHGQLDLVIGGFAADNPYVAHVAFTRPYLRTSSVVAVPADEPIPDDLEGVRVAVEAGTEEAGLLASTDAIPVPVEDVTQATGPRVVDDWLLDDLALVETSVILTETEHVLAVRHGENGWLVTVERFLFDHASEIEAILNEEGAA